MIILILLISLFISHDAFAELYAVQREDGGVSVINYLEGSKDTLEDVVKQLGYWGRPIHRIKPSDLPSDRTDRKYWTINHVPFGKKIKIDNSEKEKDEAKKAQVEQRKRELLKLTAAEFEEAKAIGLIK